MSLFLHVVWFQCPSSSRVTDDARIPALVYRCTHALHFTSFKEPCPELIGSRDRHRAALLRADQPMVAQPLHDAELVSWAGEVVHRLESTSLPVKERVSKSALRYHVSIGCVALMRCASDILEVPPKTAPLSCVGPQASLPEAFGVGARLTYLMSSAGEIVVA